MKGNSAGKDKMNNALEHEFVSDGDAADVRSTICLDSSLNLIALACVSSTIVRRHGIVAQEYRHVHFSLFDGFELS